MIIDNGEYSERNRATLRQAQGERIYGEGGTNYRAAHGELVEP